MTTNAELIQYYTELLILQYKLPRAEAHVEALMSAAVAYELAVAVRDGYDIETAVGHQQDVLSKYLNTRRIASGIDYTLTYFGYGQYTEDFTEFQPYGTYSGDNMDSLYLSYLSEFDGVFSLTDEELRFVHRLAAVRNNLTGTLPEVDEIMERLFGVGNYELDDGQDMTVEYRFLDTPENRTRVTVAESQSLIPKPAAVQSSFSFVPTL